jgi:SMC domain protein
MDIGARWVRAALQVNPFGYEGHSAPSQFFDNEEHYNSKLLDVCGELDIRLMAITDHWRVDSAVDLIAAATDRGIVALPGFEANSSEGIHILVLFEAGTPLDEINAAIGRCGPNPGCPNGTTGESYATIMSRMAEAGALPIPAHVNVKPTGLLTTRSGQPLATMIKHPDLHAIGISPHADVARDQDAVMQGTGDFERVHPLAVIHADDVMGPRQLKGVGASTWFKVSSKSLESLKLAVRTPETRISLSDPQSMPRARIKNVSWVGGFLDNVTVPISSDLTALIGGRGAGKSTVIESLRYALELQPISTQMDKDHKSIISSVLRVGTIVRVEVESVSPTLESFTIQREVNHQPVVLDASGKRTNFAPSDVIGSVEVFGQHELAELAGDSASIARLVQRFAGYDKKDDPILEDLRKKLRANREKLKQAEADKARMEGEQANADRLEEQLDRYQETDVPGKLQGHERLTLDEAVFKEALTRVKAVEAALEQDQTSSSLNALVAPLDNIDGAPQADRLSRASDAMSALYATLMRLRKNAAAAVETARTEITAAQSDWSKATLAEKETYAEILRELSDAGLDPGQYIAKRDELAGIKAAKPLLEQKEKEIERLLDDRTGLLNSLRNRETDATERLHDAIRSANDATDGVVVVRPTPTKDRSHIANVIKSHVNGRRTQIMAAIDSPDFTPVALAKAIRGGNEALGKLGIKGAQSTRMLEAGAELARELEELTVGLGVEVLLRMDGVQGLRSMDQLSKGQRATALLLLLLGASDAPLIIDQPEDDLDNNFVYKGVVRRLRELKGKRQIIASTHNANVPVLGDAELIVALESDGTHGHPAEGGIGSLDERSVRSLAENILEGGPAAFNARQHLYGF